MNVRTLIKKTAAAAGFAAMLSFTAACAHHDTAAESDFGHVGQEGTMTSASAETTAIPGPAKVDSTGNVYTSSAAPGTGNASTVGTNTNVNVIPDKSGSTSVRYDQTASVSSAPTPVAVEPVQSLTTSSTSVDTTPTTADTSVTTTTTSTTTTETTPMTSSVQDTTSASSSTQSTDTTATTTTKHRRMRKD